MPHPHVMVEDVEEEDEEDIFIHNDLLDLQEDPEDSDDEEEGEQHLEKGDRVYTVNLALQPRRRELFTMPHQSCTQKFKETRFSRCSAGLPT
jgi:hypothetical protein